MSGFFKLYKNCRLCPRKCSVNRRASDESAGLGFCGETSQLRVAYVGPHFGEEPPISGTNGSGTVFFPGCSLKCLYCQNYQISHQAMGICMSLESLILKLERIIRVNRVHNINFVSPDHFFPHVFSLVSMLRKKNIALPVVFNVSGYQSTSILKLGREYVDIYLPDFKYADSSLSEKLSGCRDYPKLALEAIAEMVGQKGFLDSTSGNYKIAGKGVLVRHLILPGCVRNSIEALTCLFVEFGSKLPISLMSQYHPLPHTGIEELNRFINKEEFDLVYSHALELGFENLFVQFPEGNMTEAGKRSVFFPDFHKEDPFD